MNNNINSFINLLLKTIEEDKVFVMPINGTSMLPFLDSSRKVKLKKATNKKHDRSINKESKKENKKESNLEYQKYLDTLQKELRNKNKII